MVKPATLVFVVSIQELSSLKTTFTRLIALAVSLSLGSSVCVRYLIATDSVYSNVGQSQPLATAASLKKADIPLGVLQSSVGRQLVIIMSTLAIIGEILPNLCQAYPSRKVGVL